MPNRVLEGLRRNRAFVLISAFVVSALAQWRAPPDVISMALIAVSMYLLFELGLRLAGFFLKR
jgi:sec-independent protein translocase protein TatC